MHNGANKKKCVRAGVTLSQPTARQASASPRSRVSGRGGNQEATTSSSKRKLLKYSSWRFSLKNDRLHKTRTRARAFTTLFFSTDTQEVKSRRKA